MNRAIHWFKLTIQNESHSRVIFNPLLIQFFYLLKLACLNYALWVSWWYFNHNVLWSYSSSLPSLVPFPLIFTSFKLYFVVFFVVMGWGEGYKNGFWEREICGETNIANRSGNMYAFILNSIVIVSQVQIYGWESWGSREVNFLLYPMAVGLLLWVMCLTLFGKKKNQRQREVTQLVSWVSCEWHLDGSKVCSFQLCVPTSE